MLVFAVTSSIAEILGPLYIRQPAAAAICSSLGTINLSPPYKSIISSEFVKGTVVCGSAFILYEINIPVNYNTKLSWVY